jgi:hypothetical protein
MGIFNPPSIPAPYVPPLPTPPPPPPTPVDPGAETAAKQNQASLAAASGYGDTIQTGGQGVTTPASTTFKTLLGQ